MGYKTEFNWVLKLKKEQGFPEVLDERATCQFQKRETRIYPIKIPIFFTDSSWNVCASVIIKEFTVKDDTTSGTFEVTHIFPEPEKQILTKVMRNMYEKRE